MGSSDSDAAAATPQLYQNVVVMRHGDRLDNFVPLWAASAPRPWDPPLVEDGKVRAFGTGEKFRKQLGFPIHRVFVSPFLRCLETAAEVVSALCAVANTSDDPNDLTSNGVIVDPSKIKLFENVAPKDEIFSFDINQCEAVFPAGTVDNTVEMVYKQLPKWQETVADARARYVEVMKILADKYPSENLLLVTHVSTVAFLEILWCETNASATVAYDASYLLSGEGVGSAVARCLKDVMVSEVEYCGYAVASRPIVFGGNSSFSAGDFVGSSNGLVGISLVNVPDGPAQNST
ncbi:hypothetical protein Sango_1577700 [Sesamum angolense]|uniref:Phosphoglycerate mutase family protein n=1 Tax=Sesamum angolense TaxID=2727404 RepID=A0AAE1WQ54_9LAMI|nr:hypothetical protein Sango_1577700 [Sesamum angolense]